MIWSFTEGIRNLRYQIDYAKIDYIQRYYSTSHNSRVIQTRIGNEQLLSLRTYPNDEYLAKPGKFLVLEKKSRMESLKNEILYLRGQTPTENASLQFTNDAFLDFSRLSSFKNEEEEEKGDERSSKQDEAEEEKIDEQSLSQDGVEEEEGILDEMYLEPQVDLPKKGLKERLKSFKSCYQNMHLLLPLQASKMSIPSPILETLSGDPVQKKGEGREFQHKTPVKEVAPPRSVGSRQSNGSEVWKNVLNDISLSAARVSIGHAPKPSHHFKDLSSDFIDAEMVVLPENDRNVLYSSDRAVSLGYMDKMKHASRGTELESTRNYYDDFLVAYETTYRE